MQADERRRLHVLLRRVGRGQQQVFPQCAAEKQISLRHIGEQTAGFRVQRDFFRPCSEQQPS